MGLDRISFRRTGVGAKTSIFSMSIGSIPWLSPSPGDVEPSPNRNNVFGSTQSSDGREQLVLCSTLVHGSLFFFLYTCFLFLFSFILTFLSTPPPALPRFLFFCTWPSHGLHPLNAHPAQDVSLFTIVAITAALLLCFLLHNDATWCPWCFFDGCLCYCSNWWSSNPFPGVWTWKVVHFQWRSFVQSKQ